MRQLLPHLAHYVPWRPKFAGPPGWTGDSPSRRADFSRMQPEQPNPWHMIFMIFTKMISGAGAKEAELQGASSVVRRNEAMEAVAGET